MKRFMWWLRADTEALERAKRADAEATENLRKSKINARWVRTQLDRDGFAEQLVHIIQGGAS